MPALKSDVWRLWTVMSNMAWLRKFGKYGAIVLAASYAIAYPWDAIKLGYKIAGKTVSAAKAVIEAAQDSYDEITWKRGIERLETKQDKRTKQSSISRSSVEVRCELDAPGPERRPYSGIYNWAFENKLFRAEGTPYPYTISFDKDKCNVSEVKIDCSYGGREGTPLPTNTPWREADGPWGFLQFWEKPHRYKYTEVAPPQPLGSLCSSVTYTVSNGRTFTLGDN